MTKALVFVVVVFLTLIIIAVYKFSNFAKKPTGDPLKIPIVSIGKVDPLGDTADAPRVAVLAQDLQIPWSLVFLPDRSILLTERPGRVRLISVDGKLKSEPVATIDEVRHVGEGGLLGIEIHPRFSENKFVYVYYTYAGGEAKTLNRVVRYKYENERFSDRVVIVDAIPGAPNHNGGRIKFGPDGFLYVTTGDAQEPSFAQDKNSLSGKILRIDGNGNAADGNPFGTKVYSYGHRNPQGLAWDSEDRLFETEHGNNATDEFNLIESGKNYGWPTIRGDEKQTALINPLIHSGTGDTWAPSGAAFLGNSVFFAGLRGSALYEVKIDGGEYKLIEHFKNEFGRIRDVVAGQGGLLYILTNNTDGRGKQVKGDDKVLVINPKNL